MNSSYTVAGSFLLLSYTLVKTILSFTCRIFAFLTLNIWLYLCMEDCRTRQIWSEICLIYLSKQYSCNIQEPIPWLIYEKCLVYTLFNVLFGIILTIDVFLQKYWGYALLWIDIFCRLKTKIYLTYKPNF